MIRITNNFNFGILPFAFLCFTSYLVFAQPTVFKADPDGAKQFFDNVLFPYWDWYARQDFFSGDNGDRERFAFWELVPLSFASFPEASQRAIQWRPSKIDYLRRFVHDAVNDSTLRYPNEPTELLISLLEFDPYPPRQKKDWHRSWDSLKDTGARRLNDLEDALARKGVSLDENV